jgi:DNA-directed RNA polymerase subunit RPC12/RpoP
MAADTPQRAYRAACPGCGAPIEFRSAQSTHAVCGYCQSSVVRSGDTLARIGKMAELFGDFSPLQLQASGAFQGRAFTLVGRLQYHYAQGTWTEWCAVLDDGSPAVLSEDNGAYVFVQPATLSREVPPAEKFRVGASTAINGKTFAVASNESVSLLSAQGELPHLPALGASFVMVELRSADGEVLSIDYGLTLAGDAAVLSRGRSVLLDDLKLTGLREESATNEKGNRQFNCPNCGAPVEVTLATSQSITCRACNSLMDLSKGVGKELKHALQRDPINPLIPLGRIGELQGVSWQVVGFQHRMGHEPGDRDESFGWEEYLLYNRKRGFTFLVDASDGWSLVKPLTGAPAYKSGASSVSHLGTTYRLLSSYEAETGYVVGEFYWRVVRGQKTFNRDFAKGTSVLSQEATGTEVTWSSGSKLDAKLVATAFKLEADAALFKRGDASPLSSASGVSVRTIVIVVLLLLLFLFVIGSCSSCDPARENCSSSRSSGGSFGGFSGGGGHK